MAAPFEPARAVREEFARALAGLFSYLGWNATVFVTRGSPSAAQRRASLFQGSPCVAVYLR
jgi:hypothetical protein